MFPRRVFDTSYLGGAGGANRENITGFSIANSRAFWDFVHTLVMTYIRRRNPSLTGSYHHLPPFAYSKVYKAPPGGVWLSSLVTPSRPLLPLLSFVLLVVFLFLLDTPLVPVTTFHDCYDAFDFWSPPRCLHLSQSRCCPPRWARPL